MGRGWPHTVEDLVAEQLRLAAVQPEPWHPEPGELTIGACWVCFPRGLVGRGAAGDPAWSAAVVMRGRRALARHVRSGVAPAPYAPGLLALREGPLLDAAVRGLATVPDVLLVNATGRDHLRRAGLAIHLGAALGIPTVGVTHRPLVAAPGTPPASGYGATSMLSLGGEVVACWLRTRPGRRPLVVHPGLRTSPEVALDVVLQCSGRQRTPRPLREARRLAREARASYSRVGGTHREGGSRGRAADNMHG